MSVSDRAKAHHFLSHVNYYRLRAYWLPFEEAPADDGDHRLKNGASIDDVIALYVFDRELRLLVLDAIERIEVSFRAGWGGYLAMRYGTHGHLDARIYSNNRFYNKSIGKLEEEIIRSKDTFIEHYRAKYTEPAQPPIWMAAEIMSLGLLSQLFGNLKHRSDRQAISKIYGINEMVFGSIVHHLTHVRNICAHHGRLWNKRFTVTMILPRSPSVLGSAMNPQAERALYNTLATLGYLIEIVSPDSEWRSRLVNLLGTCPLAAPSAMGFPDDWVNMDLWQEAQRRP